MGVSRQCQGVLHSVVETRNCDDGGVGRPMTSSDKRATYAAALGVVVVAVTAAVISFSHVRTVATRAGETELTSWLLPISIDGAVVAAVSVLLADSRAGRRPGILTWLLLALGLSASLAANVASAEPTATARVVAAWPPLALALGIEVLAGLARRRDPSEVEGRLELQPWPPTGPGGISGSGNGTASRGRLAVGSLGSMPGAEAASGNGQNGSHQNAFDDPEAIRRIRALDAAAPSGRVSRLEIQKDLACGGSRAARLAELARQSSADQTHA
jgi:hypothetical protein